MKFLVIASFLTIFGLALAAPSYHHDEGHETKYIVVRKYEASPQHGWESKDSASHDHVSYDSLTSKYSNHKDGHVDDDKDAKYEFDYGVKDLKTGDIKNQWEHRDGDHVRGTYSFIEADGTTRLVEYSADDHNGFNAVVKKIGHAEHTAVQNKPIHQTKWESGIQGYEDHGHEDQGHANSYVNVKYH